METQQFLMGTLTISMAIFNSYIKLPEGSDETCAVCSNGSISPVSHGPLLVRRLADSVNPEQPLSEKPTAWACFNMFQPIDSWALGTM